MYQETFGSYIRKLREENNMPLRKLAAYLDIDQSTLSKIETNQRQLTKEMIPILAKVFRADIKELKVKYLSEKILYEIQDEEHGLDALKAAEEVMNYSKTRKK
jgi:transcriptional regulator with XRE-family HTH domain